MNWDIIFLIAQIPISLVVMYLAYIVHESAHVLYFKYVLNRNVKVKKGYVGTPKDYEGLRKGQLVNVYMIGVIAGFIPIAFLSSYLHLFVYIILICCYVWGCRHDIEQTIKTINRDFKVSNV
jgi:hypothetical protein|tara:strand:- start:3148 stop:3513 length:366 start_codon:yes stop_codon:yes gene_type:complete